MLLYHITFNHSSLQTFKNITITEKQIDRFEKCTNKVSFVVTPIACIKVVNSFLKNKEILLVIIYLAVTV